jgi:hypothetical protein
MSSLSSHDEEEDEIQLPPGYESYAMMTGDSGDSGDSGDDDDDHDDGVVPGILDVVEGRADDMLGALGKRRAGGSHIIPP